MRPLIVVGASVRAAAFSALQGGFTPYAIDCFADRDLAAVCTAVRIKDYPRGLVGALRGALKAPWLYTGGLENHPRLVDQMAALRPLVGNGGNAVRHVRDVRKLAAAARAAGLTVPRLSRAGGSGAIGDADCQWLVKRRDSSGGLGVRFAAAEDLVRLPRGAYLQEYVEGQAASAVFVAGGGRATLVGLTRQLLGRDFGVNPPFLYAGSSGPLAVEPKEQDKLQLLGNVLATQCGLQGLFNIDFVRTENGPCILEVNPRYSASVEVLERLVGQSLVSWHVAACEEKKLFAALDMPQGRFAAKAIVYARSETIVPAALDRLVEEWNGLSPAPGIADLPRIGERIQAGHPVVTVLAEGESMEFAEAVLRRRVAAVEQVLRTKY